MRPPRRGQMAVDAILTRYQMSQDARFLTAEQVLLTTLMVQLAVVAVLPTMLVRFPWFRRILLTEKRDWPERLVFAASLGLPLTAGVIARMLLNYEAADVTLAGSFLAGLLAGPYAGAFTADVLGPDAQVRAIVDTARVSQWFEEHRRGAADHSFALWAVWMLERWARLDAKAA